MFWTNEELEAIGVVSHFSTEDITDDPKTWPVDIKAMLKRDIGLYASEHHIELKDAVPIVKKLYLSGAHKLPAVRLFRREGHLVDPFPKCVLKCGLEFKEMTIADYQKGIAENKRVKQQTDSKQFQLQNEKIKKKYDPNQIKSKIKTVEEFLHWKGKRVQIKHKFENQTFDIGYVGKCFWVGENKNGKIYVGIEGEISGSKIWPFAFQCRLAPSGKIEAAIDDSKDLSEVF